MVDIERDVPGKTADRICQAPIQTACRRFMSSMWSVGWNPCAAGPTTRACGLITAARP